MKIYSSIIYLLPVISVFISGCSDDSSKFPSAEGKAFPYILKEDCKFTIVEELSKASVTSPIVTGADNEIVSMGTSVGDKSIMVSNCIVIENSHGLPIYED